MLPTDSLAGIAAEVVRTDTGKKTWRAEGGERRRERG